MYLVREWCKYSEPIAPGFLPGFLRQGSFPGPLPGEPRERPESSQESPESSQESPLSFQESPGS